mgnify:CR=1 FL=1
MQLKCGQCGAPFRAADLHLDRGIAVCSACGGVQRLPGPAAVDSPSDSGTASPRKPSGDVPIPTQFTVEDAGHELTIRQRWFQWAMLFLMFFAIAWDSFLVGWFSMFAGGGGPPGVFGIVFFVFPIAHVAVGVGLTYFVLAGFLNSTVIRVADGMLTVRHGPLPWRGNLDMPTDSIEQIYCQKKLNTNRDSDGHTTTSTRYEVHAVVAGQKQRLLGGLHEADHALFVEQRLERFLRIDDRAVPGEMAAT